ncbi:MAG: tetratricopeptide repeat protein [Candidatus Cloacimonetes bacterium]|nr:tetratricopeptide repeat protein [Candidatus Cloacimonadota bacterium]
MANKKPSIEELKAKAESGEYIHVMELGWHYQRERMYDDAIECFRRVYDNELSDEDCRSQSACAIGYCYDHMGSEQACRESIKWYEIAADLGDGDAAYRLGVMYEERIHIKNDGDTYGYRLMLNLIERTAAGWFLRSAELGHSVAMFKCAGFFRHGKGFIRNYVKSFDWMLKAACHDKVYCVNLSEYFRSGIGVVENLYEAYVWAVMAVEFFRAEELSDLEIKLPKEEVLRAQREAEKRDQICKLVFLYGSNAMDLYNYMREVLKNDHPAEENIPETDYKAEISELANVQGSPAELPVSPDPDPDPTPGIAYSYISVCKKHFNPELVTFELVVPRKLTKNETMDFTRLKIIYDGKDTDVKNIMMYTKIRLNEKQRRLLILLAAQNSISDKELRAKRIHRILSDRRWETSASILNHMFKSIFPGCSLSNKNCMINRQSGYIAPKLKIDTTKITNARDYPLCGL